MLKHNLKKRGKALVKKSLSAPLSKIPQNRADATEAAGMGFLVAANPDSLFVYIVRHGKTNWNYEGRFQGQEDIPLNGEGRAQAKLAAAALRGVVFDAAWSSDLSRAAETAKIILGNRRLKLNASKNLREQNYGQWAGRTSADIIRMFPEDIERRKRDRFTMRPTGGESLAEMQARVVAQFEKIAGRKKRGNILVVTHGGPSFAFISHVIAPDSRMKGNFTVQNCAVNIVARTKAGWKLMRLNDTCHLSTAPKR